MSNKVKLYEVVWKFEDIDNDIYNTTLIDAVNKRGAKERAKSKLGENIIIKEVRELDLNNF